MPSQDENIVRSSLPPTEYPNISVAEYLRDILTQQNPLDIALIDPKSSSQLTYGALHRHSQQFATALLQLGITKSDVVLFLSDNCLEYCEAMFGAIYLGVTFTQAKPANGAFEVSEQIKHSKATVVVFGQNQATVIRKMADVSEYADCFGQLKVLIELGSVVFDDYLKNHAVSRGKSLFTYREAFELGSSEAMPSIPHYAVESPASEHCFIGYTSGSTGAPKGVIHSHRSFVAMLMNLRLPPHFAGLKMALPFPIGHMSGTILVPQALEAGMTVVLFDTSDLDTIVEAIDHYRIEVYIFAANVASSLAQTDYSAKYDLSCLKVLRTAGSKIADHLLLAIKERYGAEMWELYGATEFVGSVHATDVSYAREKYTPGNIGQVLANVEMKIADLTNGAALPAGEVGEICFRGAPCFIGYLNNEAATREAIDADGWYHSGDVGYYDDEGCLFTCDRIKAMIKYKIWSIIPAEIEAFLLRHPAVWSVCVTGVPHVTDGYWIRAYVQVTEGEVVTEQELLDYVKEHMGIQKQLRAGVHFVTKMPQTAIGKLDRQYFCQLAKRELLQDE